jgi:hypothetical protein
VEKLLGWERNKERARTLGVQWHEVVGAENLEAAIEAAEAEADEDGESSFEFFMNEFEEMGFSFSAGEFTPKTGPRRKKPKPPPPQGSFAQMFGADNIFGTPSIRQMKRHAELTPQTTFEQGWDGEIRRFALTYAHGRGIKETETNEHFADYKRIHHWETRSDWLLSWTRFLNGHLQRYQRAEYLRNLPG